MKLSQIPITVPLFFLFNSSLSHEECERALLPTLEHASLVHSHLHHPEPFAADKGEEGAAAEGAVASAVQAAAGPSEETSAQTVNAIIYIAVSFTRRFQPFLLGR